jgi:hypothetical protein
MAPIEKVPTVIDDRLMQSDNDLAGCSFDNTGPDATGFVPIVTLPSVGSCASSTDGTDSLGTRDEADQSLRYQIQVVSGPNFHAEEGSDPYTWQICGSRSPGYGENDCDAGTTDIIGESERFAFRGAGVYDQSERFGADGRFFTADDGAGADAVKGNSDDTLVVCTGVGADNGYTDTTGTTYRTENCDSDPGADDVYGTADDGVIFFQEAIEDGFRSGTRENRPFAFSFIDAQASLRQVMTQSVEGFLASCLNCNSTAGEHAPFAAPGPLNYDWTFPGTLATQPDDHPPAASGSVPVFLP